MRPTEDLMNDHAAIMIVLNIMKKIADNIRTGNDFNREHVEKIIDFLKNFADKCHHGKEESVLFPAMEDAGISRDNGPVGVMLYEHTEGRKYIAQMVESLSKSGEGESSGFLGLAEAMILYVNLLQNHIMKENNILFPMADNVLDEARQRDILLQFEEIENNVVGKGVHEQYHQMIHQLEQEYLSK